MSQDPSRMVTSLHSIAVSAMTSVAIVSAPAGRVEPPCHSAQELEQAAARNEEGLALRDRNLVRASDAFGRARLIADLPGYSQNQAEAEAENRDYADALALYLHALELRGRCQDEDWLPAEFEQAAAMQISSFTKRLVTVDVKLTGGGATEVCIVDTTVDPQPKVLWPLPSTSAHTQYIGVDDSLQLSAQAKSAPARRHCSVLERDAKILLNPGTYCVEFHRDGHARVAVVEGELRKKDEVSAPAMTIDLGPKFVAVAPGTIEARWYEGVRLDFLGLNRTDIVAIKRVPGDLAAKVDAGDEVTWVVGPASCSAAAGASRLVAFVNADTSYVVSIRPVRDGTKYVKRSMFVSGSAAGTRHTLSYRLTAKDSVRMRAALGIILGVSAAALVLGLGLGLGLEGSRQREFAFHF